METWSGRGHGAASGPDARLRLPHPGPVSTGAAALSASHAPAPACEGSASRFPPLLKNPCPIVARVLEEREARVSSISQPVGALTGLLLQPRHGAVGKRPPQTEPGWKKALRSSSPTYDSTTVNFIMALSAKSSPSLNTAVGCDYTTSLGSQFRCLVTLSVEKFLMSNLNFPWHSLCALILSLGEAEPHPATASFLVET